jgi:hypothetical protein
MEHTPMPQPANDQPDPKKVEKVARDSKRLVKPTVDAGVALAVRESDVAALEQAVESNGSLAAYKTFTSAYDTFLVKTSFYDSALLKKPLNKNGLAKAKRELIDALKKARGKEDALLKKLEGFGKGSDAQKIKRDAKLKKKLDQVLSGFTRAGQALDGWAKHLNAGEFSLE